MKKSVNIMICLCLCLCLYEYDFANLRSGRLLFWLWSWILSFIPWFNKPNAFWGNSKCFTFGRKLFFHGLFCRKTLPTLRLALMLSPNWLPSWFILGPIVGLLAWTFLKEGIVRMRAMEMFLLTFFYAKHRALISLAVETSLVTAYFTSKATFVQMFKCFQQDGSQAELIKL